MNKAQTIAGVGLVEYFFIA